MTQAFIRTKEEFSGEDRKQTCTALNILTKRQKGCYHFGINEKIDDLSVLPLFWTFCPTKNPKNWYHGFHKNVKQQLNILHFIQY